MRRDIRLLRILLILQLKCRAICTSLFRFWSTPRQGRSPDSDQTEGKACRSDSCNDGCKQQSAEIRASKAATVTALACDCVHQKEDPTDYGDRIQNRAPEIVPRRERSVSLRQKHIRCFCVDFVFHFFTPSSAIAETLQMLHL